MVFKSFRSNTQVTVKNQSNSNSLNRHSNSLPDDVQQTIAAVKNEAAPNNNANLNPNANIPAVNPGQTLANGPVLPSNANVPLTGSPIYDGRIPPTPEVSPTPEMIKNRSGGLTDNRTVTTDQTSVSKPEVTPPTTPEKVKIEERELPQMSAGRNEQVSLTYSGTNSPLIVEKMEKVQPTANKPGFGTVFPVRLIGALHTLQTGGLVRLELTRMSEGRGWQLAKGTIFVGRVAGGADRRLFVSLLGYLDSRSNSLIELSGDLLGRDGALGLEGNKKRLQSRWKKVLGDAFNKATQLGSAYLLGRRGGNGSFGGNSANNYSPESISREITGEAPYFVMVPAGTNGYVMINDLPSTKELPNSPVETLPTDSPRRTIVPSKESEIADEELIRLLTNGSPEEIRAAMPRMSPAWQELARRALAGQTASR